MQTPHPIDTDRPDEAATQPVPDAGKVAKCYMGTDEIELTVSSDIDEVAGDWRQLTASGLGNPYQTIDWCRAYLETIGNSEGVQLAVALGRIGEVPVFLLPMCVTKQCGVRTLTFLGTDFSNQNTGLWNSEFYKAITSDSARNVLQTICEASGTDCVLLRNVPKDWHGKPHPLALPNSLLSPSPVYRTHLQSNFEEFYTETHNKRARKNLQRKEKNLRSAGSFEVVRCTEKSDIKTALETFLSQRDFRAQATGIPNAFSTPDATAFLQHLLAVDDRAATADIGSLQMWTLEAARKIRATYICAQERSTIYVYSNSVAHDDMLPNSPALILAKEIIKYACEDPDIDTLDMGLGQERYKEAWTSPMHLCDSALSVTLKGQLLIKLLSLKTRIKTSIRNSERLWPLVRRFRQWKAKSA
ncbi:MAG: GNAT family N-acetyltransferase [Roseibium sp.]